MENKNNKSSLPGKLFEILIVILGLLAAAVSALFALVKNANWKGLVSDAKATAKNFDKEKGVHFVKANKKALLILVVAAGLLLILADSLFYTPVDMDYTSSDYSGSSGSSYTYEYRDTTCYNCHGSKNCPFCNGSGIYRNYGQEVECVPCRGYGICASCNGTGSR